MSQYTIKKKREVLRLLTEAMELLGETLYDDAFGSNPTIKEMEVNEYLNLKINEACFEMMKMLQEDVMEGE
jgi:hypothetical protein